MPITQITLENFKGVAEAVTVPLRPITLLFGANSAGKSTLLQALLYFRELLEHKHADADLLPASGSAINLGGFRQFVHGHELSNKVRIGVTVTVDDDGLPDYRVGDVDYSLDWDSDFHTEGFDSIQSVTVSIEVSWDTASKKPWITEYEVSANGMTLAKISASPGMRSTLQLIHEVGDLSDETLVPQFEEETAKYDLGDYVIPTFNRPLIWENGAFSGLLQIVTRYSPSDPDPEATKSERYILGEEKNLQVSRYVVGAGELVLRELRRIRYLGPIRTVPERDFSAQRTPDECRWADGSAAWDWLHLKPEFLTEATIREIRALGLGYRIEPHRTFGVPANSRLGALIERARLGDVEAFADLASLPPSELMQIKEHSSVRIVAEESGLEVAPCDIGVGVAQVMPVVIGAMAPGYSVLAVEQPELHVHPAVQTRLADTLATQIIGTQERLLLLETHSEHLMLRLLRRVRETAEAELPAGAPRIAPEDLSVLYVSNDNGRMQITELPVTPDGDFSRPWPKGFFEERVAELF